MKISGVTIEEVTDPGIVEAARVRAEQGDINAGWLENHWSELLPGARGKFLAVAGGEGFVADTAEAGWAWVDQTHLEDGGAFVRYVPRIQGPRIYANRRHRADL